MRLTIVYVCCKFHKNRFYSKKSYDSVMPLCNHVCGLQKFQPIWTKLGTPTGEPRRGPPTNFEENPTTLSGLQRLKAKMTRKNLADVWRNLQDICIYVLYTFPENLKRILILL